MIPERQPAGMLTAPGSSVTAPSLPGHPRVGIVAGSLDRLGGQEIQAHTLVRQLRAEGFAVTFVPIDPRFPAGLRWLRAWPYARTVLNQGLYVPSLRRLRQVDVAHVFSASYWSFLLAPVPAMLAARRYGKRVVLNYRSGEAADHLARWGRLVHPGLRLADAIVVPSVYLQQVFARHGYHAHVIPNVVDLSRFRYRERWPLAPRLLSTRNLEPHYRVDAILEAFALVRTRYPEATLTVAGTGTQETRLRALARALDPTGIRFIGRVAPDAMPALCDEADIAVNASVVDNQPVSILEAFAAGLPVVSTPTGDLASMVRDGETGLTVPAADSAALAKAVIQLLERPEWALTLARGASHEIQRFTWARVRHAWVELYTGGGGTR
jgi:glycosyltransferase involved in cell wall biosynthesis